MKKIILKTVAVVVLGVALGILTSCEKDDLGTELAFTESVLTVKCNESIVNTARVEILTINHHPETIYIDKGEELELKMERIIRVKLYEWYDTTISSEGCTFRITNGGLNGDINYTKGDELMRRVDTEDFVGVKSAVTVDEISRRNGFLSRFFTVDLRGVIK